MGLRCRTELIEDPGALVGRLADPRGCAWVHEGDGFVAWGEAARIEVGTGDDRFARANHELRGLFDSMEITDDAGAPGSGPLAFGAIGFDAQAAGSVLIIPAVVIARREGFAWTTVVGDEPPEEFVEESQEPDRIRYWGPSVAEMTWLDAVARAEAAVRDGDLEKVVLARDVRVWSKTPLRPRRLLGRLHERFPECYTFAVDGLIGSTPELLIRRTGDRLESLVLAGSAARGHSPESDDALGRRLLDSAKDAREHEVAVRSVTEVLEPMCARFDVAEPTLLKLANVQHIATRVTGVSASAASAFELAGALHPTAAVCGLPRRAALDMIRQLEHMDRARYSGPVGWVDARGNGEWGIALRCAELDEGGARLFAGAGIVEGSKPESELEETRIKLRAMQGVLEEA